MTEEVYQKSRRKIHALGLGLAFCLLYWGIEALRDVFVFQKGSFAERLIAPDFMSFWMRMLTVCIILLFSIYVRSLLMKREKAETALNDEHRALEKQRHINRALNAMVKAGRALSASRDEDELLDTVCNLIVDEGKYQFAWVAYIEENEEGQRLVHPRMKAGTDSSHLKMLNFMWLDMKKNGNPITRAVKTMKPCVVRNIRSQFDSSPLSLSGSRSGFSSSISIPLSYDNKILGVLNVYTRGNEGFDPAEEEWLQTLANDLAFGISMVRMRGTYEKMVFDNERIQMELFEVQKEETANEIVRKARHHFNNLMTMIVGSAELALSELDETHQVYRDLKEIKSASETAIKINEKLAPFLRKQPLVFTFMDINDVITDLDAFLRCIFENQVDVSIFTEETRETICGDRESMDYMLVHLCMSMVRVMPGCRQLELRTQLYHPVQHNEQVLEFPADQYVQIRMEAVGQENPSEEEREEPYRMSRSEIEKYLGIRLIRSQLEKHQAWISIESPDPYRLVLDIHFPQLDPPQESTGSGDTLYPFDQGKGERILIIEDEDSIREFAKRVLDRGGYQVYSASSANEARVLFQKENGDFQMVLSDVVLPDANGFELVEQMLNQKPTMRVLFSSGYASHEFYWPAIQKRGFRFLSKPYDYDQLLRTVREVLCDMTRGDIR